MTLEINGLGPFSLNCVLPPPVPKALISVEPTENQFGESDSDLAYLKVNKSTALSSQNIIFDIVLFYFRTG